ncbi:hypothetical protein M0812_22222 [Anaeramoeba flamelloides]|uniref:Uncharacterized protein n=1 Tax=Anaeramoeba flamelloides TaxID=1746091 RepID=A0AAV7YWV4_9EUKA|nr:hypothetical protein M0812_22222 [Anaeramoeba flamelloides]
MENLFSEIQRLLTKTNDKSLILKGLTMILEECSRGFELGEDIFDLIIDSCLTQNKNDRVIKMLSYQIIKQSLNIENESYLLQWKKLIPIISRDLDLKDNLLCLRVLRILAKTPLQITKVLLQKTVPNLLVTFGVCQDLKIKKCLLVTLSEILLFPYEITNVPIRGRLMKEFVLILSDFLVDSNEDLCLTSWKIVRQLFVYLETPTEIFYRCRTINSLESFVNQLTKATTLLSQKLQLMYLNLLSRFTRLTNSNTYYCFLPLAYIAIGFPNTRNTLQSNNKKSLELFYEKCLNNWFITFNSPILYELCYVILKIAKYCPKKYLSKTSSTLLQLYNTTQNNKTKLKILYYLLKSVNHGSNVELDIITLDIFPVIAQSKARKIRLYGLISLCSFILEQSFLNYWKTENSSKFTNNEIILEIFNCEQIQNLFKNKENTFFSEFINCFCLLMLKRINNKKYLKIIHPIIEIEWKKHQISKNNPKSNNNFKKKPKLKNMKINFNEEPDLMNFSSNSKEDIKIEIPIEFFLEIKTGLELITALIQISKIWTSSNLLYSISKLLKLCDQIFYYITQFFSSKLLEIKVQEIIHQMLNYYQLKKIQKINIGYLFILSKYCKDTEKLQISNQLYQYFKEILFLIKPKINLKNDQKEKEKLNSNESKNEVTNEKETEKETETETETEINHEKNINEIKPVTFTLDKNMKIKKIKNQINNDNVNDDDYNLNNNQDLKYLNFENKKEINYYLLFQGLFILSYRFPNLKEKILTTLHKFKSIWHNNDKNLFEHADFIIKQIHYYYAMHLNQKWYLNLDFESYTFRFPNKKQILFYFEYLIQKQKIMKIQKQNIYKFGNDKTKYQIISFEKNLKTISAMNDPLKIQYYFITLSSIKRLDCNLKITNISKIIWKNIIISTNSIMGNLKNFNFQNKSNIVINEILPNETIERVITFNINNQLIDFSFLLNLKLETKNKMLKTPFLLKPIIIPPMVILKAVKINTPLFNQCWKIVKNKYILITKFKNNNWNLNHLSNLIPNSTLSTIVKYNNSNGDNNNSNSKNNNDIKKILITTQTWFNEKIFIKIKPNLIKNKNNQQKLNNQIVITFGTNSTLIIKILKQQHDQFINYLSNNLLIPIKETEKFK